MSRPKARSGKRPNGQQGHNGGPPLDDDKPHVPEWGTDGIGTFFWWKKARAKAWRAPSHEMMLRRQERAEKLGLTYEEYTLEILERGRFLGEDDAEAVAAVKARRKRKRARQP
jgi:hypothetical protein